MTEVMKKIILQLALFLIVFLSSGSAFSAEQFALAMHGDPKYSSSTEYFDYVDPDAPKGGTLHLSASGTFDNLNPYAIKGKAATGLNLYYDQLMARAWNEPFTMYPLVAESIEVPEDRSSITFHINPNAKFHDGSPITARDVMFTFETLREKGRPNHRRIYRLVEDAKRLDDLTIKFSFRQGFDRETVMIMCLMPVLSEAWWATHEFDSTILEAPLASGPYKIAEVDPGRRIVYERAPNYWAKDLMASRGHYNFDKIIYDYYRDDTVAFEAFKAGDTDLRREWDAGKWASSYDFPAVKDSRVRAETLPHNRPEKVRALIFNTRRPPFDNIKVREALNYVLDFNWLNENLFHNQYQRANSYYPNSELAARGEPSAEELALLEPFKESLPLEVFGPVWQPPTASSQQDIRTNLRKASKLLDDAGWTVKDGVRINKETGTPFSFEILLSAPEDEKVALSFSNALKRLGIEARIRVMDDAAFRGRLNEYDYDMVLYFWQNSLSPGTEQMLYWSCEAANQPARWNFAGMCEPAIDSLATGIANAKTREDLVAHTRALDRVMLWNYYMIPLYYPGKDFVAYKANIHHPKTTPVYGMVLETWWEEKEK